MIKLDTITPKGLNLNLELPLTIHIVIPLSDNSGRTVKIVRETYPKIKLDVHSSFFRKRFITAYSRHTNLKDTLV